MATHRTLTLSAPPNNNNWRSRSADRTPNAGSRSEARRKRLTTPIKDQPTEYARLMGVVGGKEQPAGGLRGL
jgi:hypothetical protein